MIILTYIQNFLSILIVSFRRLWHNLGISASALIGIVSVLSLVVCVPIFSQAITSKVLRNQLEEKVLSTNRRLFSLHIYRVDTGDTSVLDINKSKDIANYIKTRTKELVGLDIERIVIEVQSGVLDMMPPADSRYTQTDISLKSVRFFSLDIVPQFADIIEGEWPKPDTQSSDPMKVAVSEALADEISLNVGDRYKLNSAFGNDIEIDIAGIWRAKNPEDPIWFDDPSTAYSDMLWIPEETYQARLTPLLSKSVFYVSWYVIINENNLNLQESPIYARGFLRLFTELEKILPGLTVDYSPLDALGSYQKRTDALTTLFYTVGAPMIVLALLFIALTSRIAVQQYEQETATMRGRGTSWFQVLLMNLSESLLLILIAAPVSIIGGFLGAEIMGNTTSFLKFTNRTDFQFSLEGINFIWLAAAIFIIILTRLLPMLGSFRTSIVKMKQEQSRNLKKPIWERFYLDLMLLIPGIYAYVIMRGWAKPAKFLSQMQLSGEQYRDPLLFIAPAIFSISLCLIVLRLLPLFIRLFAFIVERLPGVWAYLSLEQIARRSQDHTTALQLIMISLSLAIFSASTAKTLDKYLYDYTYYKTGADLSVREYLIQDDSQRQYGESVGASSGTTLTEFDAYNEGFTNVEQHLKLPSVVGATRIGKYKGTYSFGVGENSCMIMGIDRMEFPQVAFYRDDFANNSLGVLMNALGAEPMGVLVSSDLAARLGLYKGDQITLSTNVLDVNYVREMLVVGTYDYFPTIYPSTTPTFIVNLEYIFDNPDAVIGYNIWLHVRENTDTDILLYQIRQMIGEKAVVKVDGNGVADLKLGIDQPERVGLFGVLNVGFLMTGLMPGIGFLLYSYASLKRRFIQLGILQAIGLSVSQLVAHLVLEQFLLMGIAIGAGAGVGLVTSILFVPFLQTGAAPGAPVPPFQVLIGWGEATWLSAAFAAVLLLTMVGTIFYLVRLKIFQAVKLGETL